MKLNELALGYSGAVVSAVSMLIVGIFGNFGIYTGMVDMMSQTHMFFSINPLGILLGIIEAAIIGFVFAYSIGWIYNKFD